MSPRPGTPLPPTPAPESGARNMIMAMGAIGFVCGLLIVSAYHMTAPIIERKKVEALEKAIFEVVPGAATKKMFTMQDGKLVASDDEKAPEKYYACYDQSQNLVGVAVEAHGQGFQDVLHLIYGYSPAKEAIGGLKVLESKETPGLGDRIEKDPAYRANFDSLQVEVDPETHEIVHPIEFVKHGEKTDPWQIEGITGATISSRSVANILEKSTAEAVPVITDNLDALEGGGK